MAILFFFSHVTCFGQFNLSGTLRDKNEAPLEFITVGLFKDSIQVAGTFSDSSGAFLFENIPPAMYSLKVSYLDKPVENLAINLQKDTNVALLLTIGSNELGEVVIQNRKPAFERKSDRFVFNVSNSPLTVGSNLWDVIGKTPLVKAKETGAITVGMQGMAVYINDRKINLSGEDLMNYLKAIPSDNILKIEVITIPPSKYEAGTGGGVLNIVLKKNMQEGTTGTISLSSQQSLYNTQQASVTVNYKHKRYEQLLAVSYNQGLSGKLFNNNVVFKNGASIYNKDNYITHNKTRYKAPNFYTGMDYEISPENKIGLIASYNSGTANATSQTVDILTSNDSSAIYNNKQTSKKNSGMFSSNLHYNYNGSDTAIQRHLELNLDFLYYLPKSRDSFFSTPQDAIDYCYANTTTSDQHLSNYSLKADYSQLLFGKITFESGIKYSFTNVDNVFNFYLPQGDGWNFNASNSSVSHYKEGIAALYTTLQREFSDKLSVKLGARLENTRIDMQQEIISQHNTQNYNRLLPTLFISYKPNTDHQFSLSCNTNFYRPDFFMLNPTRFYLSQRAYTQGNPFLQPSFMTGMELSYTLKHRYIFTATHNSYSNLFSQIITQPNDSTTVFVHDNYGKAEAWGLGIYTEQSLLQNKCNISIYANANYWKQQIIIQDELININSLQAAAGISMAFPNLFRSGINASLEAYCNSREKSANTTLSPYSGINIGFSRLFEKQGIKIACYVNDLLNGNRKKYFSESKYYSIVSYPNYYAQYFRLSVTKNFGNAKMKALQKKAAGNSDISNRL